MNVASLVRWEWFKLRRRWMPWILLVILVLFSQLAIWGSMFEYRNFASGGEIVVGPAVGGPPPTVDCDELLAGRTDDIPPGTNPAVLQGFQEQCRQLAAQQEQRLPELYDTFTSAGAISTGVGTASAILAIMAAVLTASTIGTEYGWGTMRTTIVRGTGRWQYLAGKFGVIVAAIFGALVVIALLAAVGGALAAMFVDAPSLAAPDATSWADAALSVLRATFGALPIIAFVALITVLTTSSATGMGVGIGYTIAEPILVALLGNLLDWFEKVADFLLMANVNLWLGVSFGPNPEVGGGREFAILTAYAVAFVIPTVWLILRRDVAKATGT